MIGAHFAKLGRRAVLRTRQKADWGRAEVPSQWNTVNFVGVFSRKKRGAVIPDEDHRTILRSLKITRCFDSKFSGAQGAHCVHQLHVPVDGRHSRIPAHNCMGYIACAQCKFLYYHVAQRYVDNLHVRWVRWPVRSVILQK